MYVTQAKEEQIYDARESLKKQLGLDKVKVEPCDSPSEKYSPQIPETKLELLDLEFYIESSNQKENDSRNSHQDLGSDQLGDWVDNEHLTI